MNSSVNQELRSLPDERLGEYFIRTGLINQDQLDKALETQKKVGGRLGEIIISNENIRPLRYYKSLAEFFDLEFIDLSNKEIDKNLIKESEKEFYFTNLVLPFGKVGHIYMVATANPTPQLFNDIRKKWGKETLISVTANFDILWKLNEIFGDEYLDESINDLVDNFGEFSARTVITQQQTFSLLAFIAICSGILYAFGMEGAYYLMLGLTMLFTFILGLRLFLGITGLFLRKRELRPKYHAKDEELPVYTILVPSYKETEAILRQLTKNLLRIDYPKHKLDIKMILEADDVRSLNVLKTLNLPSYFEFIIVPDGQPRTKPKACNYALKFARGEFLTIYDAEDKPDPQQLRLAYSMFKEEELKGNPWVGCVQCYLNFYNSNENWLARMFTLEYTYWFQLILAALSYYKLPIPLGGTSNHLRTEVLFKIKAWDPFNMTEDADLGIRLEQFGYHTKILSSLTLEEANCHLKNWVMQRTRWNKGFAQTLLVHLRHPLRHAKNVGIIPVLSFHLFIGGSVINNLFYVILWIVTFLTLVTDTPLEQRIYQGPVYYLSWFNFIFGSIGIILLHMFAVFRVKMYSYVFYALTAPLYWALIGFASFRALLQLIFNPFKWEKTEHGISEKLSKTQEKLDKKNSEGTKNG